MFLYSQTSQVWLFFWFFFFLQFYALSGLLFLRPNFDTFWDQNEHIFKKQQQPDLFSEFHMLSFYYGQLEVVFK